MVIPVYNSEKSLMELTDRISGVLKGHDYEVILVDDASTDSSFEVIRELRGFPLTAVRLTRNFGQQNAIKCGLEYAAKDYVITMDDDLQHRPEDILSLVELCHGHDVVYGIYDMKRYRGFRNFGSWFVNHIFNTVLNKPENIRISSFRCMKREVVDRIRKNRKSFVYLSAMILGETRDIANVRVGHNERKYGKSNYNYVKLVSTVIRLYVYYSNNRFTNLFMKDSEQYEIGEVWSRK